MIPWSVNDWSKIVQRNKNTLPKVGQFQGSKYDFRGLHGDFFIVTEQQQLLLMKKYSNNNKEVFKMFLLFEEGRKKSNLTSPLWEA